VAGDAADAPAFETEVRQRSVVKGHAETTRLAKQYLRAAYTDDDGVLYCQVCHDRMLFKVNGHWYFEVIQFVPKRAKSHHQNALALCPLCAALYIYTRETCDNALVANLRDEEIGSDTSRVDVPVILNGKREAIWFTGKHALDLKTVLGTAGAARDDSPEEEA